MSRVFVKGTRSFSDGRRAISRALGIRQIRRNPENSNYVPRSSDVLLNWGQYGETYNDIPTWINHPAAVEVATHKLHTFDALISAGVPTVEYTTSAATGRDWMVNHRVLHRTTARGSQGRGISECHADYAVPTGGFFVKVFGEGQEVTEYRLHVVDGEIIDATQKRRRSRQNGYEGTIDPTVRSWNNGWVFCREGVIVPETVRDTAINAVRAVGLDFGAVDIAVSEAGQVCVYELNTAPGLEGTTLARYTTALEGCVRRRAGLSD